jgi:RNA polymerase sigma-70 factor (ECF subfamily)
MPSSEPSASLLPDVSDPSVVDEVLRGNREMFEVIVRRYNPRLFRVGMSYLRDHAQTEDAMQNSYLKAFLNLSRFNRSAAFSTWLTRIMINECLMMLRRPQHRIDKFAGAEKDPALTPTEPATDSLTHQEMKSLLERAIADLPRNYRTVYVMREVQELTTAETAACLGVSNESVKVTLHRARERLKTSLLKTAAGVELFEYPATFCDGMTERVLRSILATR